MNNPDADAPVPYWPAYLPTARPDVSERYWPTAQADTELEAG